MIELSRLVVVDEGVVDGVVLDDVLDVEVIPDEEEDVE